MNEKLEYLRNKKLRQKINYLKTELEETQIIFDSCLIEFNKDFGEYFKNGVNQKSKDNQVKKEVKYDIPRDDVNKVFKKIATKTHPDKTRGSDDSDRLEELYKEAQQSVESKDWSKVVEIADELGININDIKKDDYEYLNKSVEELENKISQLKKTYAWVWKHTEENGRENLKSNILKTFEVKEKKNGNSK